MRKIFKDWNSRDANFHLPRTFFRSQLRARHGTDGHTYNIYTYIQRLSPYGGKGINNCADISNSPSDLISSRDAMIRSKEFNDAVNESAQHC